MKRSLSTTKHEYNVRAVVVAVGGGGIRVANRMKGAASVESFVIIDSDHQSLGATDADDAVIIHCPGEGQVSPIPNPEFGRRAVERSVEGIRQALRGADLVFVVAAEGGSTGTGAAPVVARAARSVGALTIGVACQPSESEGTLRTEVATHGTETLRQHVDSLIVVPSEAVRDLGPHSPSKNVFDTVDEVLCCVIVNITDALNVVGTWNTGFDFSHITSIFKATGLVRVGIGTTGSTASASAAVTAATNSVLLGDSLRRATRILLTIRSGADLPLPEYADAVRVLTRAISERSPQVITTATCDPALGKQTQVVVYAATTLPEVLAPATQSTTERD